MPIYEYLCQNCNNRSEILQGIHDPHETTCPACHKKTLKRLVSAAGFQLKGTGWYATDFRNLGKKPDTPKAHSSEPAPSDTPVESKISKETKKDTESN